PSERPATREDRLRQYRKFAQSACRDGSFPSRTSRCRSNPASRQRPAATPLQAGPTAPPKSSRDEPLLLRRFSRFGRFGHVGIATGGVGVLLFVTVDIGVAFNHATHARQTAAVINADQRHAL